MTTIETKAFRYPFELKDFDADARTFTGLASTWERDLQDDVIERGAFRKTLGEWRKNGRALPLLDSHDPFSIRNALGKLDAAEEREAGLWTRWKVVKGDDGDGALARIEAGIIDGLSIGYRPVKLGKPEEVAGGRTIRHIKEIELKEVSLVLFPANLGARVDPVKWVAERPWTVEQRIALAAALTENDGAAEPEPEPEYGKFRTFALRGRIAAVRRRAFAARIRSLGVR